MTKTDTIRYVVYASHLGEGENADEYAARLDAALRDAYPGREVLITVRRGVQGVGSGLQGEPEGVDENLVRWIAERA